MTSHTRLGGTRLIDITGKDEGIVNPVETDRGPDTNGAWVYDHSTGNQSKRSIVITWQTFFSNDDRHCAVVREQQAKVSLGHVSR
jgi:hypothetical protein